MSPGDRPQTRVTWPIERDYASPVFVARGREFRWGERTYVVAIINATPDSFSGDGIEGNPALAAQLAREFEAAGADIVDIGGESSRPGAEPLTVDEERARVLPAIRAVRDSCTLPISIDTYHAAVARDALAAGADIVNDIWGLRFDPATAGVVAEHGAGLIAMHNQRGRAHTDVATDIATGFKATLDIARSAGIPVANIILDPGFGFGWEPAQNLEIIRRLPELWSFQLPLLVGPSRKSTIGLVLDAPVDQRLEGTAAAIAIAVAAGADVVRVHDVAEMERVVRVSDAIARARWEPPS